VRIGQTADVGDIGWEAGAHHAAGDDISQQNGSLLTLIHTCTAALNAVTSPLLAVQTGGDLLFGNSAGLSLLRQSRWLELQSGRLVSSTHSTGNPAFASAMTLLGSGVGSTVLLTDLRTAQQAVATVAPISFGSPSGPTRLGLVWLTTSELENTAVTQLSRLFNLTRAEEHLLTQLVGGAGVREAAARHKVSIHTARNQLKSILHKTGRHSQTQLLTLIARMASLQLPLTDQLPAESNLL
jgi:DNA-binding CsgD family transcriptional regulator